MAQSDGVDDDRARSRLPPGLRRAQTCRVVTRGRRTGVEHVVQVWFVIVDQRWYAASRHGLAGDWVRNALHAGGLTVRLGRVDWHGTARRAAPEDLPDVLDAFAAKYQRHPKVIAAWRADPPVFVRAEALG